MAKKRRKRNASRGSVNNIILKTLVNGDKYGYEIIKEVEELSGGKFLLKQPSLYSSLSRFEDKNFVSSYWQDSDIGGRRHYYHLTDLGLEYYKVHVLKEIDDEETSEEIEIKDDENELTITKSTESVNTTTQEIDNKTNNENLIHQENLDNLITAIEKYEETTEQNVINSENKELPWMSLSQATKKSNRIIADTKYNKLYTKKPKKVQKIIKDTDGIFKLRDEDFVSNTKKSTPIVIDNVGKRTTAKDLLYSNYETKTEKENKNNYSELSEEEKLKRNENFLAKFNLLTMSKMKPVSTPTPKQETVEKKPDMPIDYRSKLDAIYNEIESIETEDTQPEKNNLFEFSDNSEWNDEFTTNNNNITDDAEDKIVELEPIQEFEVKQSSQYEEKINKITTDKSKINMSRYEYTTQAILQDKTYLLNNKIKFVFGLIMSLLMIAEVSVAWYILDKQGLVFTYKPVFIVSYVLIGLFALFTFIPYFIHPNNHKVNNFKFRYSFWFGILTFLVCGILIYCVNALFGFEIDNFIYFAVKIIVPILLASNFLIAPIIYFMLSKCRNFYD